MGGFKAREEFLKQNLRPDPAQLQWLELQDHSYARPPLPAKRRKIINVSAGESWTRSSVELFFSTASYSADLLTPTRLRLTMNNKNMSRKRKSTEKAWGAPEGKKVKTLTKTARTSTSIKDHDSSPPAPSKQRPRPLQVDERSGCCKKRWLKQWAEEHMEDKTSQQNGRSSLNLPSSELTLPLKKRCSRYLAELMPQPI